MIVHKDPCPECNGEGVDRFGEDCLYCEGKGEIDEEERFDGDAPPPMDALRERIMARFPKTLAYLGRGDVITPFQEPDDSCEGHGDDGPPWDVDRDAEFTFT